MINLNEYKKACNGSVSDLEFIFETNGLKSINLDYSAQSLIDLENWYWNVIENNVISDCIDDLEMISDLLVRYFCKCLLEIGNTIKTSKV